MSSLSTMPRAEQWAGRICTQLGKSVESIIDVGRLLVKAKDDLPHGEWGRLFEDELIPFSHQTANKLMAVAGNSLLSNPAHVRNLPPSWGTLYELTQVPELTLKNAIRDGVITPDMPRKDVKALMPSRPVRVTPPHDDEPDVEPGDDEPDVEPAPRRVLAPPSDGLQFARIAIMKLEEIRDDDIERQQAFDIVRRWIDAREAKTAMHA